jgi:Ca2+-binding EF-hand superfamily protein
LKHIDEEPNLHDVAHAFHGDVFNPNSEVMVRFRNLRAEYKEAKHLVMHQLHGTNKEAITLTVVIGMIILLSALTEGIFELVEMYTNEQTRAIVETVQQELTVLGFISLGVFCAIRSGMAPSISDKVFGTETELMEMFELIHMFVFLFMMLFVSIIVLQAFILKTIKTKRRKCEKKCVRKPAEIEEEYLYWYATPVSFFDISSRMRRREAVYNMEYSVLRGRFLEELKVQKLSPVGFDFAFYLEHCNDRGLAHSIDIQPLTWIVLIVLVIPLRYFIGIKSFPTKIAIIMCWSLCLLIMPWLTLHKLHNVRFALHGVPSLGRSDTEEALKESLAYYNDQTPLVDAFLQLPAPYLRVKEDRDSGSIKSRSSKASKKGLPKKKSRVAGATGWGDTNLHLQLFWFGSKGPTLLYHILRQSMFFTAIYIATVLVRFGKYAYLIHPVLPIMLMLSPLILVFQVFMLLLDQICLCTCVGMMRDQVALKETLIKAKTIKIVHALRLLKQMRLAINTSMRGEILKLSHNAGFEGVRLEELKSLFDKADTDNSGKLSGLEIKEMMAEMRATHNELETKKRQMELDSIDDAWEFSFEDFTAMVKDIETVNDDSDPVSNLVDSVFGILDQDDTGAITVSEFIQMLCGPNATESEQESAMVILQEADTDGDGLVDRDELRALLHKYADHDDLDDDMDRRK